MLELELYCTRWQTKDSWRSKQQTWRLKSMSMIWIPRQHRNLINYLLPVSLLLVIGLSYFGIVGSDELMNQALHTPYGTLEPKIFPRIP